MTENRRIILNTLATYGRSLLTLFIGLFTSRWVLAALGRTDFGLYGVIGGLIFFVSFINFMFTDSVARFYGISQGIARRDANSANAVEECRCWFCSAVTLMVVVPTLLVAIGYPVGVWAIRNWLNIPPNRIEACVWVFRFSCAGMWIGFAGVPFSAMYRAKQLIAELTVYSISQSILTFLFSWYMVNHEGDWLILYAFAMCTISILPQAVICIRAMIVFEECSFRLRYLFDLTRFKKLAAFAGWSFFGNLGWMLKSHGMAVLVNKYFGPDVNAAMTVSNQVNGHSNSLSAAVQGAFSPAIITAYGARDDRRFRSLVNMVCRLKAMLFVVFMLPLMVEIDTVLSLWLKTPPPFTGVLCCVALVSVLIDNSTNGFYIAICANGNISGYQISSGMFLILSLPIAWFAAALGTGVIGVAIAIAIAQLGASLSSVYFARRLMGFSIKQWVFRTVMPILSVCLFCGMSAFILRFFIDYGILRFLTSIVVVEILLLPALWLIVMDEAERKYVLKKFGSMGN